MGTTGSRFIVKKITTVIALGLLLGACGDTGIAQLSATAVPVEGQGAAIVVADSSPGNANSLDVSLDSAPPSLNVSEESDLIFNILTGEIAGRLGLLGVASESYLEASAASSDERVSERAVKLAIFDRNFQRAELASARWIELAPQSREAWQHRAQVLVQLREVDSATAAIEQLVSLSDRETAEVMPSLLNEILRQVDADTSSQLLERLASRYEDSPTTQFGIGQFAMNNGNQGLAMKAFERALSIDPDHVDALFARAQLQLSRGDDDEALTPVTEYLSRSPDNLNAQMSYARLLVDNSRIDGALDQLEVIYSRFSDDADTVYSIALLALEIRRTGHAEHYLNAVIALGEYQDEANFYLGRISDSRDDYAQALVHYLAVEDGEFLFRARIRAAELYGFAGEVDKGRDLLVMLRSTAVDESVMIELFDVESRLLNFNNQYGESLQLLSEGIDQHSNAPILLYSRALVAEKLGQLDLFEADLKKVLEIEPDHSHALNALGYALVTRNERLDEAEKYLLKAHTLSPDDAAITDSLGWLYYHLGRYADALRLLKQAYAALPDPEIAAHLGEVLWVTGDKTQATSVWEDALRGTPADEVINQTMQKYIH